MEPELGREFDGEDDSDIELENEQSVDVRRKSPVDELMDAIDEGDMLKVSFNLFTPIAQISFNIYFDKLYWKKKAFCCSYIQDMYM